MKSLLSITLIILLGTSFVSCQNKEDFSSPDGVVQTFIDAGMNKDQEILSKCFSENSPGEWDKFRNKSLSGQELEELKEFVDGAKITGLEKGKIRLGRRRGSRKNQAVVLVKFKSRDEKIRVVRKDHRWYIVDF